MAMMQNIFARAALAAICITLLFQAGCAGRSQSARFYVLSPDAKQEETIGKAARSDIAIAIGQVSLPKYLRKPQIVTRTGSNELHLAEYDRWAGRLGEDIGRVIAENLAYMLSTDRVLAFPAPEGIAFDYTVEISFSRFDGRLGGDLELSARWVILDSQAQMVSGVKATHIVEQTGGRDYADMVAAQSRALALFSSELADAIKELTDR